MSIDISCDVCGMSYNERPDVYYQLYIRDINDPTRPARELCVCHNCMPEVFLKNSMSFVPETTEAYHRAVSAASETGLRGMKLRDFLESDFYLHCNNLLFCDMDGTDVVSFLPYLDWEVYQVQAENENGMRYVVLQPGKGASQ